MNIEEYIREPFGAAMIAGGITALYVFIKAKLNSEPKPTTSQYAKPAVLVAILVYFIVMYGCGRKEHISTDPF